MDFFRHENGVLLAVGDAGGDVALFDPETGAPFVREGGGPLRITAPQGAPVHALSHLRRPSGWPALATVGGDGTARVYDIATGAPYAEKALLAKEELRVVETFQDPDGSATIAVAGKGDNVYLWRADASSPVVLAGHTGPVRALQALRTERLLAVADERGITVWCIDGPDPVRKAFIPGRSRSLAVLRDLGQVRLASATSTGLHLWDPETGDALAHFASALNASAVVAFEAEDDEQLLAVASDSTVALWSPAAESPARRQLARVPDGTTQVLAKILTGNGTLLAAADDKGSVAVWRLTPQRRAANLVGKHDDWVNDLVVVGPSRRLVMASASDDRTVQLWSLDSRPARCRGKHSHETQVQALAMVGDGLLASGDQHGVVRVWSTQDSVEPKWVRRTAHGTIRAMTSFRTSTGWWLVTAGNDGHCTLWDVDGRGDPVELRGRGDGRAEHSSPPVRAVAAAELNGRWYVAAGDLGGRLEVWDAATGAVYWTLDRAHPTQVRSLAALRVGGRTLLASGGSAGEIRLWDLAGRERIGESAEGHSGPVAALCVMRDGQTDLLASGGADRSIRLWDPEAIARPISEISNAHDSWVRALVQVSNDESTHLASGGEEGAIKLWPVRDRRLVRITHWLSLRGFRDRLAKTDVLDRRAIVDELSALLAPDVEPVTSGTSGPQVVMVQGAWGTGKSSVMHDLRERLEGRAATRPRRQHTRELTPRRTSRLIKRGAPTQYIAQPVRHTVTAWFNPWAHESSEQVWSGLAWTIVDATRSCLGDSVAERQAYWLNRNIQRLDRAALRRTIRQRIWRPTLTALAGLLLPLGVSLVRIDTFDTHNVVDWLPIGLAVIATLVVMVLGGYGLCQHLFGRVTAYLPADIFDGPVDQASLVTAAGERLLRDPPYVDAAGQLYRINGDIRQLTKDLGDRGYQLVVFIDDLDRCSRRSTADVFEAINSFLSDRHFPETAPRFVIGLDATVVAGRLAETGTTSDQSYLDPDDPGPGWSILRKLSQLTVVLPGIRSAHTTRLLRHHAPRPGVKPSITTGGASPSGETAVPAPPSGAAAVPEPAPGRTTVAGPAGAGRSDPGPAGGGSDTAPELLPLEGEPTVHEHLRRLIRLRPRQTMRETKRLLTLWAFYMRLLERVMPPGTTANVRDACDALTLAEIVRRWPALVPALARTDDGPSGLGTLIAAIARDEVEDDRWTRNWHAALKGIGLTQPHLARATQNLHRLLREHGNERVASFADRLL